MAKKIFILVAMFLLSVTMFASATDFTSVGNSVIRDTDNNLEWTIRPTASRTWAAQTAAAAAATVNGISDWRLPTKTELLTLVVSTNTPKIDAHFHLGPVSNWALWTSSAITVKKYVPALRDRAYFVSFFDGQAFHDSKLSRHAALFVRDYAPAWQWLDGTYITWNDGTQITLN